MSQGWCRIFTTKWRSVSKGRLRSTLVEIGSKGPGVQERNEMERWVNAPDKMLPQAFIYSTKPVRFSICVERNSISKKQRESWTDYTLYVTKYDALVLVGPVWNGTDKPHNCFRLSYSFNFTSANRSLIIIYRSNLNNESNPLP